MIDLLASIASDCAWPDFVTKMAFVPKTDGGLRPMAPPGAPARVHGRPRRPLAK